MAQDMKWIGEDNVAVLVFLIAVTVIFFNTIAMLIRALFLT